MTSAQPPDWAINTPQHPPVHTEPALNYQWAQISQDQIKVLRRRLIEAIIQIVVQAVTGLFVPGGTIGGAFEQLEDWASTLLSTAAKLLGLEDLLGLVPFLNANSALPIIGSGQLQNFVQNLLMNPFFEDLLSFIPGAGIIWDALTRHSATGGSAKFTPNGTAMSLISNGISVLPGDILDLSIWTKWLGLTGSGPISLVVNAYDAFDNLIRGATQVIHAIAMPGLTGDWTKLFGTYTVPTGMGVKSVAASFNVSSLLNGGSVWFDDGSVTKPNLVGANIITGPGGLLDNLPDEWTLLFDTLGNQAFSTISDIENRLAKMLNDVSALNANNILTGNIATDFISDLQANFNNLVEKLLGWDPLPGGSWYSPSASAGALSSQASTILGHGGLLSKHDNTLAAHIANFVNLFTRVTALEAVPPGGGGGGPVAGPGQHSIQDDFERTGALGSNWSVGSSSYQCDGHNAYWNVTSYASRTSDNFWVGTGSASNSDYQNIAVTIGNYAPTSSGGYYGWNYVHGRVGGPQVCTFAIRADGYWEFRVLGGVVASGTGATLGTGSRMELYCGDKPTNTLNKFRCVVNLGTIWSGTASSSTGSGFRGWGFGSSMNGTGVYPFGSAGFGGKVNQFSATDVL